MANNQRSREKRREERIAEESKAASGDRRTRLLQFAAGGVFLAIIVVVVVIIAVGSGGSSGGDASNLVEKPEVEKLLNGIPQYGTTIGKKSAPVKLYEYGDLQCPICKEYSEEVLPEIIENQVKKGEVEHHLPQLHHHRPAVDPGRRSRARGRRPGQGLELHRDLVPQPGRGELGLRRPKNSSNRWPSTSAFPNIAKWKKEWKSKQVQKDGRKNDRAGPEARLHRHAVVRDRRS